MLRSCDNFINKNEVTAITGLLPGGKNGKLKNNDGSLKYTHIQANTELFAKQTTPYVYPLFKVHKIAIEELINIKPMDVSTQIPSRLVAGMSSCQLTRIQIWLEQLLSPLAICYGKFEYIKDSCDFLKQIEDINIKAVNFNWNWDDLLLFTIDVKALYPSVKFEHLALALHHCFDNCTAWSDNVKATLIDIVIYTLENQQIYWNNQYYMLNQGITTGGKHSVPLANIFLSFILKTSLNTNPNLNDLYTRNMELWGRFIDDCGGVYKGTINDFVLLFNVLQDCFKLYDLELTCDTDTHKIDGNNIVEKEDKFVTFLDIELFKSEGSLHSREHRKDTSVNSYLKYGSAHPKYTFAGIVKSQLYRIRRLCSRDNDFVLAVKSLEERCLNSGYKPAIVTGILSQSGNLQRSLSYTPKQPSNNNEKEIVRLVILTGTYYENEFCKFAKRMNSLTETAGTKIEIVRSTNSSIGQLLFNNNGKCFPQDLCNENRCFIHLNDIQNKSGLITSTVTGESYPTNGKLGCVNGGIYVVNGCCSEQYTGKTIHFGVRTKEHLTSDKKSAIHQHKNNCSKCKGIGDFQISLVENYLHRGKYSLSEREFLWNKRIKGLINLKKTLSS